jgi:hypothetical protein
MSEYDFSIFAEHFQFYVQDRDTDNLLSIYWDEDSRDDLFAQSDEIIGIATVRNMEVPVSVSLIEKEPEDESLDEWDHVVQSFIAIPSGKLMVTGPASDLEEAWTMSVEPGVYGVRAYYGMLDEVDGEGFEGDDFYKVSLWKTDKPRAETEVLKRWTPSPVTS